MKLPRIWHPAEPLCAAPSLLPCVARSNLHPTWHALICCYIYIYICRCVATIGPYAAGSGMFITALEYEVVHFFPIISYALSVFSFRSIVLLEVTCVTVRKKITSSSSLCVTQNISQTRFLFCVFSFAKRLSFTLDHWFLLVVCCCQAVFKRLEYFFLSTDSYEKKRGTSAKNLLTILYMFPVRIGAFLLLGVWAKMREASQQC